MGWIKKFGLIEKNRILISGVAFNLRLCWSIERKSAFTQIYDTKQPQKKDFSILVNSRKNSFTKISLNSTFICLFYVISMRFSHSIFLNSPRGQKSLHMQMRLSKESSIRLYLNKSKMILDSRKHMTYKSQTHSIV